MRAFRYLALALTCTAGVSALMFKLQGGFGAGHGRFDRAIGILGCPWVLLPWPTALIQSDFLFMVMLPFLMNVLILMAVRIIWRTLQRQP